MTPADIPGGNVEMQSRKVAGNPNRKSNYSETTRVCGGWLHNVISDLVNEAARTDPVSMGCYCGSAE